MSSAYDHSGEYERLRKKQSPDMDDIPRSAALEPTGFREHHGGRAAQDSRPLSPLYAAIGLASVAAGAAVSATRRVARVAAPLGRAVLHPPVLTESLHPARAVDALAGRGRAVMTSTGGDLERIVAVLVPAVVREVLDTLDLNVVIHERVDLSGLVAKVDVGEVIGRVDIDAVVRQVDIDAIVQRIDLDAVLQRVDLDAVAQRVDLDAIADRIDVDRIVSRIDVDAIVDRVDLNAIVDRLDVAEIAEEVIDEIDLPEIIRDSTGSMASQVVREARMESFDADEALSRLVDRLFRRRGKRSTDAPGQQETDSASAAEREP
jgi:hypothetical protein